MIIFFFIEFHHLKSKRFKKEPTHLKNYFVTTTTSSKQDQILENDFHKIEEGWKIKYFHILDVLVVNMKKRFSSESLRMANAIDNFIKLDFIGSLMFIEHYKVRISKINLI